VITVRYVYLEHFNPDTNKTELCCQRLRLHSNMFVDMAKQRFWNAAGNEILDALLTLDLQGSDLVTGASRDGRIHMYQRQ